VASIILRLALALGLAFFAPLASAYIDPNTGGYLFQLLAPLLALALSAWIFFTDHVKAAWRSIRNMFSRKVGDKTPE